MSLSTPPASPAADEAKPRAPGLFGTLAFCASWTVAAFTALAAEPFDGPLLPDATDDLPPPAAGAGPVPTAQNEPNAAAAVGAACPTIP